LSGGKVVLIDVRDDWEIQKYGKIEYSGWINIPWDQIGSLKYFIIFCRINDTCC